MYDTPAMMDEKKKRSFLHPAFYIVLIVIICLVCAYGVLCFVAGNIVFYLVFLTRR